MFDPQVLRAEVAREFDRQLDEQRDLAAFGLWLRLTPQAEVRRAQQSAWQRAQTKRRSAQGRCWRCTSPSVEGRRLCATCAAREAARQRAMYARKRARRQA